MSGSGVPELRLSVLGPLVLTIGGQPSHLPGAKRRAVLALLAMASPSAVAPDSLVDAVWPGEPPASGRAALQSHVSRLRRHLGPHAGRLEATEAGYRLTLEPPELDATELTSLVSAARAPGTLPEQAVEVLRRARTLWRDRPLTGLLDLERLAAWSRTLTDTWLAGIDQLAELSLAAGDAGTACDAARQALEVDPLREPSAVLLVRALDAQGRAPEALREAHRFRQRMREETGLDPSPALAAVEQQVAAGGAKPAVAEPAPASPPKRAPAPVAELFGRDAELAGVTRLLESERLVTLVGPGGVGKTHLALEVAHRAGRSRTVDVLQLAPVTDDSAVTDVLARTLEVQPGPGDLLRRCALRLAGRRQLLVVDNCEHLLATVRDVVSTLLAECPELTVLATSRERLGIPAEQTCRVTPLPLPDDAAGAGAEHVPSVALFLDRARRARQGFRPDTGQVGAIARIVRSLDGMPLAIELAAGRLSSMSIADLEARIDRALDLLATGGTAGGSTERHRTLRAAVQWSYDLLPGDEQVLFRHLAVFPGGFDLATAEQVAATLGTEQDPATTLAHLVDASMLVADLDGSPRYRMLDTLRRFGLDRLDAGGERDGAERLLVSWAVDLARWIEVTVDTDDEPAADLRLRAELANLRTAWQVARQRGDLDSACSMVVSLYPAVTWRDLTEAWRWTQELADDPAIAGHPAEAAVLGVAAEGAWFSSGDLDRAERLANRAVEVLRPGDAVGHFMAHWAMGDVLLFRGRYDEARDQALRSRLDTPAEAEGHAQAALASAYEGRLDLAHRHLALATARPAPPTTRGYVRYVAGETANRAGDWAEAEAAYRDAIAVASSTGATFLEGIAALGLVSVHAAAGSMREALAGHRDLIDRWERTGAWTQQWTTLRNLADVLEHLGDEDTASTLRAAADRAPEAASTGKPPARRAAATAEPLDRRAVLELARAAIDRQLASLS